MMSEYGATYENSFRIYVFMSVFNTVFLYLSLSLYR